MHTGVADTTALREALKGCGMSAPPGDLRRGLSMDFIAHCLAEDLEVKDNENVYDIEPRIRAKGDNCVCARDGRRGAAYVDIACDQHAGASTVMLSYGWGYTIKDIASALKSYCGTHDLNFETTCIWICCFCVNQHRVKESLANSEVVSFEEFRTTFARRVRSTGRVVGLLSPWDEPLYTSRVWCLFEAWEATRVEGKVQMDFVFPERENEAFLKAIGEGKLSSLFNALGKIAVEAGQATIEQDKINILNLIEEEGGGYESLNKKLKTMLQTWFVQTARDAPQVKNAADFDPEVCVQVLDLLTRLGQNEDCVELAAKALDFCRERSTGDLTQAQLLLRLARSHGNLGRNERCLVFLKEALALSRRGRLNPNRPEGVEAEILRSQAASCRKKNDLVVAFGLYQQAMATYEEIRGDGEVLPESAGWILLNLGLVRSHLEPHEVPVTAEDPFTYYNKAWQLYEHHGRTHEPAAAYLLRNRGDWCLKAEPLQACHLELAERDFMQARAIYDTLSLHHVENYGELCKSLGFLRLRQERGAEAVDLFEQARRIQRESLSLEDSIKASLVDLSMLHCVREDVVSCKHAFAAAGSIGEKGVRHWMERHHKATHAPPQRSLAGPSSGDRGGGLDFAAKLKQMLQPLRSGPDDDLIEWRDLSHVLQSIQVPLADQRDILTHIQVRTADSGGKVHVSFARFVEFYSVDPAMS